MCYPKTSGRKNPRHTLFTAITIATTPGHLLSEAQCRHQPSVASRTAAPVNEDWPDTGYWLNTNSNKRHNQNCENYRKTRGYPCKKNEGSPCGKCGG